MNLNEKKRDLQYVGSRFFYEHNFALYKVAGVITARYNKSMNRGVSSEVHPTLNQKGEVIDEKIF